MKVLHVIPGLAARTGGPATAVVGAAKALEELGVESTVVATNLAGPASANGAGRLVLPAGAEQLDVRLYPVVPPRRLAFSPGLARALRGETGRFDVVHVHSLYLFPQLAAYRQAVRHGVPYVVAPSGALDPWLRRRGRLQKAIADAAWQRRMLDRAAALHYKTPAEAELAADLGLRAPAVVAPNGIAWHAFQAGDGAAFRAEHGIDGPLILNVGRIAEKKGLDVLVHAYTRVRREIPDARLVLAGPDDEGLGERLRALDDTVLFPGMLGTFDLAGALAAADVWALPSHTENFGVAVLEALAAGSAVVVSPAVNVAAEAEEAGALVVCPPEPERLASELVGLLRDPDRRAELGERAREFARRYDWSAVAPRWLELYEVARR